MRHERFVTLVKQNGWTLAQVRFDVRPSEGLMELLAEVDDAQPGRYERYVARLEREGVLC